MYREKTQSYDHLTRSVFAAAVASIKPDILQQTWAEVKSASSVQTYQWRTYRNKLIYTYETNFMLSTPVVGNLNIIF